MLRYQYSNSHEIGIAMRRIGLPSHEYTRTNVIAMSEVYQIFFHCMQAGR
jgi:hypothetical protein